MNVCVIGLGSMGKRRIRILKNIFQDMKVSGVDLDPRRARNVAEEYGIVCYSSLAEIETESDCAFICTSPQSHATIIKECLEKDMHIFSEINLISDLYGENIRMAKRKNKILFLSSTLLYRSEMQIIDEKVKQNEGTFIYQYHVGQYLPDWHPWDNLKDFFVSDKRTNGCRELLAIELPWIQNVFGKIRKIHVVKRKIMDLDLDFPDTYMIQAEHENGNAGNLLIDVVSRQAVRQLEVIGETVYIRWEGTPESLYERDIQSGEYRNIPAGKYIHIQGYGDFINEYAYVKEMTAFFELIRGEKKPLYGFEEDREVLKLIDEIENGVMI